MIHLNEGGGGPPPEKKFHGGPSRLLKLTLTVEGCQPPIWRLLVVSDALWLSDLSEAIQIAFGWYDYQTHAFRIGKTLYGNPFKRDDFLVEDDRNLTLADLDLATAGTLHYDYHFGEGWSVKINIEPAGFEGVDDVPVCLAGERAGPPEDCGGPEAYRDMVECLKEPYTQLGREWLDWLGGEYDPEKCDLDAINKALSEIVPDEPED
ncbi:MAG: plasmid pRiA4b ORF-3 family protein [Opitutaceae bacterium]|jgi:hypothetical protein|nr:plasmid pRiA4b ORF-3 family protein [Opitutaceae bacterium]